MAEIYVAQINQYPVKSCAGISLESAELDSKGIKRDREFMVVDSDGKFVSQRSHPRMALINARVSNGLLCLIAQESGIAIPILKEGKSIDVIVHEHKGIKAIDQGDAAASGLGKYLGGKFRLVRMAEDYVRRVNPDYAKRETDQVGFADGYPLLLISQESLDDLNSKLSKPVKMNRFRPNIVINGGERPFFEDDLKQIRIGNVIYDFAKPCDRCNVPAINQESGEIEKEAVKALSDDKYRRAKNGSIYFGQNLIHQSPGRIAVGDKVEILAYKNENEKIKWKPK